jgi:uncharacterized membrane protein HdeD (DUF308 family)
MNLLYGAAEVDVHMLEYELSKNWGFILAAGIINVIGGIIALSSPITATVVAMAFLTGAMILMGFINLVGVCYVENCYRLASLLGGSVMLLLGVLMATHAVESILVLTSLVAALFMVEGLFRSILALKNRDMPGWGFGLASGICAIFFSILIICAFPRSSETTLGILLGVNWLTYGAQRVALGMMGRATANGALQAPHDYVGI